MSRRCVACCRIADYGARRADRPSKLRTALAGINRMAHRATAAIVVESTAALAYANRAWAAARA